MKIVCCDYEINLISKKLMYQFRILLYFFKDLVVVEIRNKFLKVNSVQEACTKCFAVHILKFEILPITLFFVLFFHVVYKISNRKAFGAKASCTELTLHLVFLMNL